MALTVNTNVNSLNVQKDLNRATDTLTTTPTRLMQRLSPDLLNNSAEDDLAKESTKSEEQHSVSSNGQIHDQITKAK